MYSNLFSAQSVQDLMTVLPSLPFAIWETFYVTVVSTALSLVLGLPLGVLLVAGEKNGVLPLPRWLMQVINVIINLLRSIPFLILMIMVFPLSRLIGTAVGTTATIVPLVAAAFPFVARLVESSLREVDGNIIEAAQSMGATPMQIICKVMIPESVPSLIQNVTISLTTILGYSAMSGIIGGGGLGKIAIDYGYYRYKYLVMLVAAVGAAVSKRGHLAQQAVRQAFEALIPSSVPFGFRRREFPPPIFHLDISPEIVYDIRGCKGI